MRLRFDDRDYLLKVTHPRHVRPASALAWAVSHKEWVAEQLERALPPEPFVPGARIPIEGVEVKLCWSERSPRTARLESGRLTCGGPRSGFARRVERFLKHLALDRLSKDTAEIAEAAGLRAVAVSVGDAQTRWGSCSSSGRIRYSWRLILAPPEARRFVVAHEVAHLKHLDHGRDFRSLERTLFGGDTAEAEALLRRCAPRLRRIGRFR